MATATPVKSGDKGIIKFAGTDTVPPANLPVLVGDSGSGGTQGAVPAPASGDAAAGKFLKADGTWSVPSGGSVSSVYKALVSQSGTSDPTAVVLQNDLGGTVVWTRSAEGSYRATLAGAFPANKVFHTASDVSDGGGGNYGVPPIVRLDDDTMIIETPNGDGYLVATPIMFEVFP